MSKQSLVITIVIILLLFVAGVFVVRSFKSDPVANDNQNVSNNSNQQNQNQNQAANSNVSNNSNQESNKPASACQRNFDPQKLQTVKVDAQKNIVDMQITGYGSVRLQLDFQNAPKTAANFQKLVEAGFYDCLTFHRVASGFVIQGGDPNGDGTGGPGYTVPAEIKLLHKKGSVAMARLSDQVNPKKESSGSQFYIALQDLPQLDGQYTVFAKVISGLDVAEKIGLLPTNPKGDGKPLQPVVIEKATLSN